MAKLLLIIASFPLIYLLIAFGLVVSQWPAEVQRSTETLDFSSVLNPGAEAVRPPEYVEMRDGYQLPVRSYGQPGRGPLLVALHGSGWHGMQFDHLARNVQDIAHVLVPDLRGHGEDPQPRGDVSHIGQLEEDIADLIASHRQQGQKVVVLGHSSGGGLTVRLAGGAYSAVMDGAVLLAPFLQYDAPVTRANSGGWANPLTRRLIGISMLNSVGLRVLNDRTVIQFNMPQEVLSGSLGHTATTSYSYRLNTSFAPRRDYMADLSKLPSFLLVAGAEDEAFDARGYEGLVTQATSKGEFHVVASAGHLDLPNRAETVALLRAFLTRDDFTP